VRTASLDAVRRGVWQATGRGAVTVQDHARLVYHEGLGQTLLVSGRPAPGVWGWDGARFVPIADAPSPFYKQAAAYDAAREAVVIFGGQAADDTLADTSGATWVLDADGVRVAAESGPSARGGAAMAYDAARDRLVLVGGTQQLSGSFLSDTWLFDGTTWTEASPSTPAPPVTGAGLAYDPVRERVVMARPVWGVAGETWQWDGTTWAQVDTATPLPDSYTFSLAWDADEERILALAGGQLFQLDDATWSPRSDADDADLERDGGSITYDALRRRVVLLRGGSTVWEHDGTRWIAIEQPAPVTRNSAAVAYDAERSRLVMAGGYSDHYLDDTWEWDGSAWTRGAVTGFTAYDLGMAWDAARHRTTMVSDFRTWAWDGAAWTDVGAADGVFGTLLGYDAARAELVACTEDRTWVYDGSAWTAVATAPPTTVRDSAVAYDARRERLVRFGGYTDGSGSSEIDETWEWDGEDWARVTPTQGPSRRGGHHMAYDDDRGVVVLFGGYEHAETWEYDGTTWTQRVTPSAPPGSFGNGLVYDAARRRTVFYGADGRVWEYFPVGDACATDGDCASGHCIDEVCCEHVCPGPCWVCSTASGGSTDGLCEAVPDAGPDCDIPDGGVLPWEDAAIGPGGGGGGDGGCCRIAGAPGGPRAGVAILAALALFAAIRRRRG